VSYATKADWQRLRRHSRNKGPYDNIWNMLVDMNSGKDLERFGCKIRKVEHGLHPLGGRYPNPMYTEPTFYVEDGQHFGSEPLDLYDAAQRVNRNRKVLLGEVDRYKLGKSSTGEDWDLSLPKE
jgi:hypothetical protein